MGEFLVSGAKNWRGGEIDMGHTGQIPINALHQREVALSNAVGIVAGKSDLHRVVDVVPVGVVVLLLRTVRHVAHEFPSSFEVGELQVSG